MTDHMTGPPDKEVGPRDTTPEGTDNIITNSTPAPTKKPGKTKDKGNRRRDHITTCSWCRGMRDVPMRPSHGAELIAGFGRRYEAAKRLPGGDPERGWWR